MVFDYKVNLPCTVDVFKEELRSPLLADTRTGAVRLKDALDCPAHDSAHHREASQCKRLLAL